MLHPYSIRVPDDLQDMIDAHREKLSLDIGFQVSKSETILVLLRSALAEPAKGRKK
jgi:hypothetical protein